MPLALPKLALPKMPKVTPAVDDDRELLAELFGEEEDGHLVAGESDAAPRCNAASDSGFDGDWDEVSREIMAAFKEAETRAEHPTPARPSRLALPVASAQPTGKSLCSHPKSGR